MPNVIFTAHLQRRLSASSSQATGRTVRPALESVFAGNPRLRTCVLDDQGRVAPSRGRLRRRDLSLCKHSQAGDEHTIERKNGRQFVSDRVLLATPKEFFSADVRKRVAHRSGLLARRLSLAIRCRWFRPTLEIPRLMLRSISAILASSFTARRTGATPHK